MILTLESNQKSALQPDIMSTSIFQSSLVKLVGLLIILPYSVTFLHLFFYTFWQNEYCLVGPPPSTITNGYDNILSDNNIRSDNVIDLKSLYGIYAPSPNKKMGNDALVRRTFRQKYSSGNSVHSSTVSLTTSLMNSVRWPSLTQAALMISAPTSTLSKYSYVHDRQDTATSNRHKIGFVQSNNQKMWCLQSSDEDEWCSSPLENDPEGVVYQYPSSGMWTHTDNSKQPIIISCPSPTITKPSKKTKHKKQNDKQAQNVKFLLHYPTTTLLLLLNSGLAYQYWNHRISPSSLSKSYNKICIHHEWWRAFTGATAHFEPLHIGFNMMSLHTLGKELEGGFGSIIFMIYNIALVVMCTLVMMGIVYGRLAWERRMNRGDLEEKERRLKETNTIGYSSVLFALMVITTLERNQATCPIPFFSDVCFATHHVPGLPWLKFNIAPIIFLIVTQFIMPRVSFMGHLSGIACGFGLHWGWGMPPLEMCSPNVLIGSFHFFGCLVLSRKIIPVRPLYSEITNGEGLVLDLNSRENNHDEDASSIDDPENVSFVRDKRIKKEREVPEIFRKQRTLELLRNLMGMILAISLLFFDPGNSLVLSQFVLLAYFVVGTQASVIVWRLTHINKTGDNVIEQEKNRTGIIWRGFIVAAIISSVMDSMSMAAWFVLQTFISAERGADLRLIPPCIFMLIRIAVNLLGLVAASKVLFDFGQVERGIFDQLFSCVLSSAKQIGDSLLFLPQAPLWTAFEGRGIRLGSRT